jgi:hypothetical protein
LLQFGKKSVILASLLQGLFIPTVTALYFAGALKTKCSYYGSISHNNRGSFAGSAAPHFHAKEKV